MPEPENTQAAPERRIFRLTSGEGYGAVVNGNFIKVDIGMDKFYAHVYAFLSDGNGQYSVFDTVADAVAWAVDTAKTHQGQPMERSSIQYWEIRNGYSITVKLTDSGEYEGEVTELWIDSDPGPLRNFKQFHAQDEALQWARDAADEQKGYENDYRLKLREIRDALEAQSG